MFCEKCGEKINVNNLPKELKPLSMWDYFGYSILYAIPIIGLVILLINAFASDKNINLRNYSRSYFAGFIIVAIFVILFLIIFVIYYEVTR